MKIAPRHLVWVNLVLLGLTAYWGASTVSTAVAAKLTPPPQVHLIQPPPPIEHGPRRAVSYYATIQTRDIFNSTKPEPVKPAEPAKPTELKLKLWGVAIHEDGRPSYCIIEDLSTHKQDLYRVGDKVTGNVTVKSVGWDRIILDRDGRDEILDLATPQGGPLPARPAPVAAVAPTGTSAANAATQSGNPHIHKVSDNQYNIDRSEVDSALDNMSQLFTQIRAVPHFEGGQSTGFRLFAIRQNSLFDNIGLQNGDIIQNINGTQINDPARALALVQDLRNAQQLNVQILRNKETMNLQYNIGG
jgi:general secretion pathway protein C